MINYCIIHKLYCIDYRIIELYFTNNAMLYVLNKLIHHKITNNNTYIVCNFEIIFDKTSITCTNIILDELFYSKCDKCS